MAVICRVLGFCRQAFYAWWFVRSALAIWPNACLTDAALAVHASDREFGYRLVADELHSAVIARASGGCGGCAQAQIYFAHSRKRGRNGNGGRPVRSCVTTASRACSPPTRWPAPRLGTAVRGAAAVAGCVIHQYYVLERGHHPRSIGGFTLTSYPSHIAFGPCSMSPTSHPGPS